MKRIQSRDNALYKAIVRLSGSSRERRERRAALLDGPHLIEAYHVSGGTFETLIASDSGYEKPELRSLFDQARAHERAIFSDRLFQEIAQVVTPTGILAVAQTPAPGAIPERLDSCLMLENVQDAGNLGSMLRSAAAAGVKQVFLSKGSVFAWSPKVLRAGMGAHFFLSIFEGVSLVELARRFPGKVIATALDASTSLFDADLGGPIAWVFGNEGSGVSSELAAAASLRVRIPMPGQAESLNVAAAAAICLFESVRRAPSS